MSRYLLAVFGPADPGPFGGYASRAEMQAAFEATGRFNDTVEQAGQLVFVDGLAPVATATTVTSPAGGGRPTVTDGPYLETKEHLGGFWVVDVPDLDVALDLAAEASAACRGPVEVRPFHTEASIRELLGA